MNLNPISFEEASKIVIGIEHAYAYDPFDPGGETKWGIARNKHPEIPEEKWLSYTINDALSLYKTAYFDMSRCGEMPRAWGLAVFDGEVNQGYVIDLAQHACGAPVDGKVGPVTLSRLHMASSEMFHSFMASRGVRYTHNHQFARDGEGWLKRLFMIASLGGA